MNGNPAPVGEQPTPRRIHPIAPPWRGRRVVVAWYDRDAVVIRGRWGSICATPGVVSDAKRLTWWEIRHMLPMDRYHAPWWEVRRGDRWLRIIDPRMAR